MFFSIKPWNLLLVYNIGYIRFYKCRFVISSCFSTEFVICHNNISTALCLTRCIWQIPDRHQETSFHYCAFPSSLLKTSPKWQTPLNIIMHTWHHPGLTNLRCILQKRYTCILWCYWDSSNVYLLAFYVYFWSSLYNNLVS